jgi:hypothetical protein
MLVTFNKICGSRRFLVEKGQKQQTFYMEFYMHSRTFPSTIQNHSSAQGNIWNRKLRTIHIFGSSTLPTTSNDFPKICKKPLTLDNNFTEIGNVHTAKHLWCVRVTTPVIAMQQWSHFLYRCAPCVALNIKNESLAMETQTQQRTVNNIKRT